MKEPLSAWFSLCLLVLMTVGWVKSQGPDPVPFQNLANAYLLDSLLFLSDAQNGLYIYSVQDKSRPRFIYRIPLLGHTGMAARNLTGGKGYMVYANSYESLLAIRWHDDSLYEVTHLILGEDRYGACSCALGEGPVGLGCNCGMTATRDAAAPDAGGQGGSYAKFALSDSFIYYIDQFSLVTASLSDPEKPAVVSATRLDWTIETLFASGPYLFVGGTQGVIVFDRSDPAAPAKIGQYTHVRSCDPVVVRDSLAFATLRGGGACGGSSNVLISLDVKDAANPVKLQELSVASPYGLAVRDTLLYVAHGSAGFSLFNVAKPDGMVRLTAWTEPPTADFIWKDSCLYLMGSDEVVIYNAANPGAPVEIGRIMNIPVIVN